MLRSSTESARNRAQDRVDLVEDLLEPQLVRLVNDHEEHLVVGGLAVFHALGRLAGEQPIELQVLRVVERTAGLFVFHLASFVP